MAAINQINENNNFNFINFNLPIINNQDEELPLNIEWVIDRTPDTNFTLITNHNLTDDENLINNLQIIRNPHFEEQFNLAFQELINEYPRHPDNIIEHINIIPDESPGEAVAVEPFGPGDAHGIDDFIPFEMPPTLNHIVIEVQEFDISEEDCDCCICMDTRENDQICQFNCLHKFCIESTMTHYRRNTQQTLCPLCRIPVTNIYLRTEDIRQTFI